MIDSVATHAGHRQPPALLQRQRGALGKSLLALAALTILAGAATAITYLLVNRNDDGGLRAETEAHSTPDSNAVVAPQPPIFFSLQPFTVTVSNDRVERLLHVGVTLSLSNESSRARLDEYLPVVRSRILMLLSEQDPVAVQTRDGKAALMADIQAAANQSLQAQQGERVNDVLFTDFVVQ